MALFDRLAQRVSARARELADEALNHAKSAIEQIPDARLKREGDTLVIEAKGLKRRWMSDVSMRFCLWRQA